MTLFALVHDALRAQRRRIERSVDGLSPLALSSPHPPTTWTPAALVHHLALDVERWWFGAVVAGDDLARRYFDEHPGGAWTVPDGTDALALYRDEQQRADAVLTAARADDEPRWWPEYLGRPQSVAEIALHVVTETAQHAGQLDIVRESIDGMQWLVLD